MVKTGTGAPAVTPASAMTARPAAPTGRAERNGGSRKIGAYPVKAYLNGVEWLDADVVYLLSDGRWLFVSEDHMSAAIYESLKELLAEQRSVDFNESDVVIVGWDMEPYRFSKYTEAEQYAERFAGQ